MSTLNSISRLMNFHIISIFIPMGSSSSSSSCNTHENSNVEINERFHFRFTDCSCQCNANKRPGGVGRDNDLLPQATFMNAFMTQTNRSQYDIRELFE